MICSPVPRQMAVPEIGFAAFIGPSARNAGTSPSGAGASSSSNGCETEARYDRPPDVVDYLALAFVVTALAFGPAIVSLL
jgi:hypothetical protein